MFSSVEDLKKWILNYIESKGKKSLHIAINNSKSIKNSVIEHSGYLPDDVKINQRCFHIISGLKEIPFCKECGINRVNFNNRDRDWKYLDFCSPRCGRINEETIKKYKKTNNEKFGVDNISKSQYFIDKMISINNKNYGVDWYFNSDDFKSKSIATCLKKYGFETFTKTEEFSSKLRKTFLERYGVDWYTKSKDFIEKFKASSLERYGVEHPMLSDDVKDKVTKTMMGRYGKEWYNLTSEFKDYCFKFKEKKYGSPTCGFKYKDYLLPSGKTIKIQGYENFALDILLKKYDEEDIAVTYSDIREEIGVINYLMGEDDRIYLPDIYIKSENKIIEVKSDYTYNLELDKNLLKKEACLSLNLKFEFWIFDKRGKLTQTT
jgi:hypothetical protein